MKAEDDDDDDDDDEEDDDEDDEEGTGVGDISGTDAVLLDVSKDEGR